MPSGLTEGPVGVCPAGMVAATFFAAVSTTQTLPCGAAQVTYSLAPSGLSTRPVGSAGMAIVPVTLPAAASTRAICLASTQRT